MKRQWPDWTPPSQMLRRRPDLPRHMVGGIDNPLGARAIYLGSSLYRIHGSNEPETIGQAVSSGCFRMTNEDVIDLYDRVPVGAQVVVLRCSRTRSLHRQLAYVIGRLYPANPYSEQRFGVLGSCAPPPR